MDWKITKIENLDDKCITCPVCGKTETFQTTAQRNKIIRDCANCIAGDSISFKVTSYVYPTCVSKCIFCGCDVETDSYAKQQVCEDCMEKVQMITGGNE
jgi:hypothetical protein